MRIALLSIHTSPLDQPGTGDAGGMNVYIVETAKRLAQSGIEIDIFTRATTSHLAPTVDLVPGVKVVHITAGPFEGLLKNDLPGQLCAVTAGVLRTEASNAEGYYDLIHSHYWLSGQVGWLASERWRVPLVHTMHTMGKVKNLELAAGDKAEPEMRLIGEQQVVDVAQRLVANTELEAQELTKFYQADPRKIDVVNPGVDLELFSPGSQTKARKKLGIPLDASMLLFVGRIQPLKAPDILMRAAAELISMRPELRSSLLVVICGGVSGTGADHPEALRDLASDLGLLDLIRFEPPSSREELVTWYRAADLTVVPSYSESFGLVAIESQACGTPVVASAVGGLKTTVADGVSGRLIQGHNPIAFSHVLNQLLMNPTLRAELSAGSRMHAAAFGWENTTSGLINSYELALNKSRARS
ncbi:MAG: D-inositol-3-phosphate glycosyltransferase [Candidatus Nanopelagicales bacterium]